MSQSMSTGEEEIFGVQPGDRLCLPPEERVRIR
jgi:hypothetical protein